MRFVKYSLNFVIAEATFSIALSESSQLTNEKLREVMPMENWLTASAILQTPESVRFFQLFGINKIFNKIS